MNNNMALTTTTFNAVKLDWDSQYFGLPSAKVVLSKSLIPQEKKFLLDFMDCFDFVTIYNTGNDRENNFWIGRETKAFLTDMNIQFVKKPCRIMLPGKYPLHIFQAYPGDPDILEIAKKSFKHSRFFNDPWLPAKKAKEIYVHWAKNAFYQKSRFFVIATSPEGIAGFLLFSMQTAESSATIELIAVDESCLECGIGRSLVVHLESFLIENNIDLLKVGTQLESLGAIEFYTSLHFSYASCNGVFHYWPHK